MTASMWCWVSHALETNSRGVVMQAEVRVLQKGVERKLRVSLRSPHRLIPVHIQGRPPPYFILGGLVFTQVLPRLAPLILYLDCLQKPSCVRCRSRRSGAIIFFSVDSQCISAWPLQGYQEVS